MRVVPSWPVVSFQMRRVRLQDDVTVRRVGSSFSFFWESILCSEQFMRRSFRTHCICGLLSQGVALGWYALPRWGNHRLTFFSSKEEALSWGNETQVHSMVSFATLSPEGASVYQPRATPWVADAVVLAFWRNAAYCRIAGSPIQVQWLKQVLQSQSSCFPF